MISKRRWFPHVPSIIRVGESDTRFQKRPLAIGSHTLKKSVLVVRHGSWRMYHDAEEEEDSWREEDDGEFDVWGRGSAAASRFPNEVEIAFDLRRLSPVAEEAEEGPDSESSPVAKSRRDNVDRSSSPRRLGAGAAAENSANEIVRWQRKRKRLVTPSPPPAASVTNGRSNGRALSHSSENGFDERSRAVGNNRGGGLRGLLRFVFCGCKRKGTTL